MTEREIMLQKLHDYIEDNFDVIPGPSNLLEIVHIVESFEISEAQKSLLEDQTWNRPVEGEINL